MPLVMGLSPHIPQDIYTCCFLGETPSSRWGNQGLREKQCLSQVIQQSQTSPPPGPPCLAVPTTERPA